MPERLFSMPDRYALAGRIEGEGSGDKAFDKPHPECYDDFSILKERSELHAVYRVVES